MHRVRRAAAAVAAALMSAALYGTLIASPVALAHRDLFHRGRCRIGIQVAPQQITAGEPIVVFGRLRCAGRSGEAGQRVALYQHLRSQRGFSYVQSVTTGVGGYYEISGAGGLVETNRSFYVFSDGAFSRVRHVRVGAQVTLSGPAEGSQLLTGKDNKVTFTGVVRPADVGARVVLQRQDAENGQSWHRIDSARVGAGGAFSIPHVFIVPGDASIRVLVRSDGRNVPSTSNVLGYEISQAQNDALTIEASADPIVIGQTLSIKGKLVGAPAGTPLQLFAHTRHGQIAAIAETTTGAGGEYSFAPQSPLYSTFYEVKGGGETSATLFEGVHDLLSAQASATSVQQGQPVVFSGSVSPQHPGHVIYLEQMNASGDGFHVIEVGFLGAGSTYELRHVFYVTGTRMVRIYIPGGPENEGAASQTFAIQVTPAPVHALGPERNGNGSEPPEGQS